MSCKGLIAGSFADVGESSATINAAGAPLRRGRGYATFVETRAFESIAVVSGLGSWILPGRIHRMALPLHNGTIQLTFTL